LKKSLFFLFIVFCRPLAYSQSTGILDSLLDTLNKYDAYRQEIGIKSPTIGDTVRADLLYRIAKEYSLTNMERSSEYSRQLLSLSQQINYKKGVGYGYNGLGAYYTYKANDSALICFQMAGHIGEEIKNKNIIGDANNNIGGFYDHKGDYSQALKYFLIALQQREESGNKEGATASLLNIGNIYMTMRKFDDAMQYHTKSLQLSKEINSIEGVAEAYDGLGNDYADQEKYEKALTNYKEALKIDLANNYFEHASFLYLNIGDLYKRQEKYDEALANYNDAIAMSKRIGYTRCLTISYIQAGAVYETLGNLDKAMEYLNPGIALGEKSEFWDVLRQGYRIRAMVYFKRKNYKPAFEDENNYLLVYEHVFNEQTNKNITQLQMQYEFDKKEAAEKAAQEKQKLIRNMIYAGMGLALTFLVILLFQRSRIAKERRQIALEQERMRISRDLHDDLGSGLTGILMMSEQLNDSSPKELMSSNLEKIKKSSRQMVEQMGEIVWAMNTKNDTLENLVGYLNTYARDYFENLDISQKVQIPETIPQVQMTGMKRRNVFLVVKESLNNIAKHAQATQVSLSVSIEKNNMNIVVADNGKGFDKENTRRFGNGLKNMKSRMENIKGTYHIESGAEGGTKTVLTFPIT
jgi:signal transduction histidine kinase